MASAKSMYAPLSLIPGVSVCCFKLTIGASGAVTSFNGNGIESITKETADGTYTIVLKQPHAFLAFAKFCELNSAGEDITVQMISEDVDNPTLASRTVVVVLKAGATATNASSGALLYGTFIFCDSRGLGIGPTTT